MDIVNIGRVLGLPIVVERPEPRLRPMRMPTQPTDDSRPDPELV